MNDDILAKEKKIVGYTQGVFDMFHIGHLNLLKRAKEKCDYLIVGVNSDNLVKQYKHKQPVVDQQSRCEIVENIKAVDECVIVDTLDKIQALDRFHFDVIFIGDDWKGNERWKKTQIDLAEHGVQLVFLPYTNGISSSILRNDLDDRIIDQ